MEKDIPKPKTQPSGNQPPPRPPTRTAIGTLPDDEDPEQNRQRKMQREIVRINLPTLPVARPIIQQPLPTTASIENARLTFPDIGNMQAKWPVVVLQILAIWAFIGAIASTVLYSAFSENHSWDLSRRADAVVLVFLLMVMPTILRQAKSRKIRSFSSA